MTKIIRIAKQIANAQYECNACLHIEAAGLRNIPYSFMELRAILREREAGYKIRPGEEHEVVWFKTDSGGIGRYRQKPAMHNICVKHELYHP